MGTALMLALVAPATLAQAPFSSGSDGSYGAIDVLTGTVTLEMPPDGIFNCTTITVAAQATLKFNRNARNTPVYLLATGDISIAGTIDVSATGGDRFATLGDTGGPGGFDGGDKPREGISEGGDGHGPGGGSFSQDPNAAGRFLGSPLLIPLVGGGGGAGTFSAPGGGGGGAILLASSTKVSLSGLIDADPTFAAAGGGVRIVAPDLEGSGRIVAGQSPDYFGRLRVDSYALKSQSFQTIINKSYGANMVIFPPNLPELEIIEVGGQAVDPDAAAPVSVELGEGAPEQQTVKVRARNFNGTAEVTVVVVPDAGEKASFNLDIANPGPGAGEATVTVDVPANTISHLYVWTR